MNQASLEYRRFYCSQIIRNSCRVEASVLHLSNQTVSVYYIRSAPSPRLWILNAKLHNAASTWTQGIYDACASSDDGALEHYTPKTILAGPLYPIQTMKSIVDLLLTAFQHPVQYSQSAKN